MKKRRSILALGVAAAGTLVGCSTDDNATTQSEVSAPADGDTAPQTPVGSAWGEIFVTAVEQPVTVSADVAYPTDGNSNPLLNRALSEAAEEGSGGVAIETKSALEAVEATLESYPGAPETADADGALLRWESEYYVVAFVRLA